MIQALSKRTRQFYPSTSPYARGSGVKSSPASRRYGRGAPHQLGQMRQECPVSLPLLSYHSLEKSVSLE